MGGLENSKYGKGGSLVKKHERPDFARPPAQVLFSAEKSTILAQKKMIVILNDKSVSHLTIAQFHITSRKPKR
jgi:hypothetical protein